MPASAAATRHAHDAPADREDPPSLLQQPKAVWAVAFAAVVAFMGIGLVDPILPAIAQQLDAGPSDVSLLFTSYFAVTGVAMLVTGFVSSRIGPKRTLLCGLALVVVFAALAGASGSIGEIVGFRAGWGLGNALFIATALAVIVGAASGGLAGAIVLYEAALGLGIASGPLLGGLLGGISWRGPFFGTAVLMAVGFVAILVLLDRTPTPPKAARQPLSAPLRALGHPGLAVTAVVAVLYNFGFFTLLAYTPFPLGMGAHALGAVFFGWGLCVAASSVFLAPRLERRFGLIATLAGAIALVALDLVALGLGVGSQTALVVAVVVAGLFLGIVNTVMTTVVMEVAPVPRPTASAAYSFVRFTGGAVAPYIANRLGEDVSASLPFFVGAVVVALGVAVLLAGRGTILRARDEVRAQAADDAAAAPPSAAARPVVAAVDATSGAGAVVAAAARIAVQRDAPLEVVHVRETDVLGSGEAVDLEAVDDARAVAERHAAAARDAGAAATATLLEATGDHGAVTEALRALAVRERAEVLVVGARGAGRTGSSVASLASATAPCSVVVVDPETAATAATAATS